MTLYDVTVPISPAMPVWPGDPAVEIVRAASIDDGSAANVTQLYLGSHTGTHLDAPLHFMQGGQAVDQIPLDRLVGRAWIADCRGEPVITAAVLDRRAIPDDTSRLLLLTDNSKRWSDPRHQFATDFVALDESAARWVVERGMGLVGIDYASIDLFDTDSFPAHRFLLPNGVIVVENLDLRSVPPECHYWLMCLPLKIEGCDGAPARVLLSDFVDAEF